MGKITGFLEFEREDRDYEPVAERIKHWREFVLPLPEAEVRKQGARCMDCGIPYCHGTVAIKTIECAIADRAIAEGWAVPEPPSRQTGKKVAVVGSGPAGMACAQ